MHQNLPPGLAPCLGVSAIPQETAAEALLRSFPQEMTSCPAVTHAELGGDVNGLLRCPQGRPVGCTDPAQPGVAVPARLGLCHLQSQHL